MQEQVINDLCDPQSIALINTALKELSEVEKIELFQPLTKDNRHRIHFMVNLPNKQNPDVDDRCKLHKNIAEILKVDIDDIMLENSSFYTAADLNFYFEERCLYALENIDNIRPFCEKYFDIRNDQITKRM